MNYISILVLLFTNNILSSKLQCRNKLDSLITCLSALPKDTIVQQSDANYDSARFEWNSRIQDVKPLLIALPKNTDQVSKIVVCANKFNKTVAIRSGGHSYEGYSLGGKNGALVIDLLNMNNVQIDQGKRIGLVEGGTLLGKVYWNAWNNGKLALPAGTCPTVGIGGHATGGGFGRYSRTFGMVVDNILEVEIVAPNGDILTANTKKNSDLFWAIRGSGTGSYGVITKFKFQLFKAPEFVSNFNFDFPVTLDNYATTFQKIQNYSMRLPLKIGASLGLYSHSIGFSGAILADSEQERTELIEDIKKNLPPFKSSSITPMSFIDNVMAYSGLPANSPPSELNNVKRWDTKKFFKAKNGFVIKPFDKEFLKKLGEQMSISPPGNFILLDVQGGKVNSVPVDETAVVHRKDLIFDIQMIADAKNNEEGSRLMPWMNTTYDLLLPKMNGGYINYVDKDVKDWENVYYGAHFSRLQQIKKKYDPKNLFNNPRSIPL
ncbi:FAD-binding domain-containing protein [Neoconidiobolus thromboides FSU 785]|nr:FAD-binding domain-containing protein [Neoconidiobolus thromboides FSU 785]